MASEVDLLHNPEVARLLEELATVQRQLAQTHQQLAMTQGQLAAILEHLAGVSQPGARMPSQEQTAGEQARAVTVPATPPAQPEPRSPGPLSFIFEQDETRRVILEPNGIDGTTGLPLLRLDAVAVRDIAQRTPEPEQLKQVYKAKQEQSKDHLGPKHGVNPAALNESLWAVVVNSQDDAAVLKALYPLIRYRSDQQGLALPDLTFRDGETCGDWLARHVDEVNAPLKSNVPVLLYQPGEECAAWLARHGTSHGAVDPQRGVPYYLMVVGRPGPLNEQDTCFIPFEFQYELDMFWAVGRLCFTDLEGQHDLAAYTAYAEQVVAFEQAQPAYKKQVVFFGTRHEFDTSTERSADELITPLAHGHNGQPGIAQQRGFTPRVFLAKDATHANLGLVLRGQIEGGPAALLFTATHGIGLPFDHPDIVKYQGALVCQDWEGFGNIKREHWFAAEDLTEQTQVAGLIAVCFACYGAGCPAEDQFIFQPDKSRPIIAPYPFLAQLPQHLLRRGALAVLGHIDRAWTHSFSGPNVKSQTQVFEDVLGGILGGNRVGDALDQFNLRQGVLSSRLADEIFNMQFGKRIKPLDLAPLWIARNDARNYALLGDPAVRLPIEQMEGVPEV